MVTGPLSVSISVPARRRDQEKQKGYGLHRGSPRYEWSRGGIRTCHPLHHTGLDVKSCGISRNVRERPSAAPRAWRGLAQVFVRAGLEASAVGLLIGCSAPLVFLLAVDRVPDVVTAAISGIGGGAFGVMLTTNLILLAAGCVLDIGAAILLLAPLMLPVAVAAGIDPIHFGVILVVNLMLGGLTPPVGVLVHVTSNVMRLPAAPVFRASLPLYS